jgi:hypothetical protein
MGTETKICSKCGETKALDQFAPNPRYKDGYRGQCRQCARDYAKTHGAANREKRTAQARERRRRNNPRPEYDPNATEKQCNQCGESKPLESFPIDHRNGRRRNPCKACKLKQTKAWRTRNKDHVNELTRDQSKRPEYKANARERMKRWRRNNPDKKKAESLRWTARRREL